VIDQVIDEPLGGAHRDKAATIDAVGDVLEGELHRLRSFTGGALKRKRRDKYLEMGQVGLG
jgi:acetyl-CoA carboxylase carboxyl transferase subunit alpha